MRRVVYWLAGAGPLFYLLPWFMVLTIVGTVAQRYIGLVDALSLFFSSAILWIGPIPTPGGLTTLGAITLSLALKLLLKTRWSWRNGGVITSHLSVLLLLLGGGVSWLSSQEGYISLLEGESTRAMQDYYARELTLLRDGDPQVSWPEAALKPAEMLAVPQSNMTIMVDAFCSHCEAVKMQGDVSSYHGLAKELSLRSAPAPKEKEEAKGGLIFQLSGASDTAVNGHYLVSESLVSQMPEWEVDGHHYQLMLSRKRVALPFGVTLKQFEKIRYPGSSEAKEYQSLITLSNEKGERDYVIAMNEPLRIDGYALYQSSFMRFGDGREASVLSVVKNDGWLFPYLSGAMLAIGLLWHIVVRYSLKRRARE